MFEVTTDEPIDNIIDLNNNEGTEMGDTDRDRVSFFLSKGYVPLL